MVKHWWKLIRGWNVVFIAAIILLLHFGFLGVFESYVLGIEEVREVNSGYRLALNSNLAILFSISVALVAAAGNIINDVYDQEVDRINKPDSLIVGRYITEKSAVSAFWILGIGGCALAVYVASTIGHMNFAYLHILGLALLWLYSIDFKRRVFVGNLIIAIIAGGNILIVGLYDLIPTILKMMEDPEISNAMITRHETWAHLRLIGILGAFAFISTLLREIVKDMEDIEGDRKVGFRTLATRLSEGWAKVIIGTLAIVEATGLIWISFVSRDPLLLGILIPFLILPLFILIGYLPFIKEKKQYHWISIGMKIQMLIGLLLPVILLNVILAARGF